MIGASTNGEVVLLTESDGFFGQRMMPWESMDTGKIAAILSRHFAVRRATYADVANGATRVENAIVVHASSQQPEYKAFADDVLLYLHAGGNRLVPSIHIARSFENKGYQELHKRLLGVRAPVGIYVAKPSDAMRKTVSYPAVFKTVSGYGSSGVRLVRSEAELHRAARAEPVFSLRQMPKMLRSQAGHLVRRYLVRRSNLRPYGDYYRPLKRFVLQQYIPKLSFDFKVLAFHDRVFVLKRSVADNDFRASGSGKFAFDDPPNGLLDYARNLLLQFDEPYLSLDICFDGTDFHLVEFQGVHFGPYTLLNAPKHFVWEGATWRVDTSRPGLEEVIAESIVLYLERSRPELAG
jgi:glutathione synthase/RimK-type ligase-like ATP-grasp enzyme